MGYRPAKIYTFLLMNVFRKREINLQDRNFSMLQICLQEYKDTSGDQRFICMLMYKIFLENTIL